MKNPDTATPIGIWGSGRDGGVAWLVRALVGAVVIVVVAVVGLVVWRAKSRPAISAACQSEVQEVNLEVAEVSSPGVEESCLRLPQRCTRAWPTAE